MFKRILALSACYSRAALAAVVVSGFGISSVFAAEAEIRAAVAKLGPGVSVSSIKKTPISGLMEVVLSGGQVLYFSQDGKHVLQGALIETETRRNLTDVTLSGIRQVELKKVPTKDVIVFPAKGTTKHVIKIFTDIDCGYCRKLHQEIDQINALGIEVQYLWFPRAGIPSDSSRKAVAIWCAKDQRKAMTDAKTHNLDPGNTTCANPIQKDYDLGQRIGVSGTPAIFLSDGSLLPGYMPPQQLLAEIQNRTATK